MAFFNGALLLVTCSEDNNGIIVDTCFTIITCLPFIATIRTGPGDGTERI